MTTSLIILLSVLLIASSVSSSSSSESSSCPNEPILETESGSVSGVCKRVRVSSSSGDDDNNWGQVYSWLSIPYAKPPVGDLRFQPPQAYGSWAGNLDGTKYPSFCMNIHNKTTHFSSSDYLTSLFDTSKGIRLSEDCLYLNIFMSEKSYKSSSSSTKSPILVYFQNGNQNLFNPASLVLEHDIIFISINYRLDVFGFLHIKDDESGKNDDDDVAGNQAILDQSLALKWINQNAAKFGGDSTRVTLLGLYYGANLIGYQMMYKPSFPFYRNVILNSGTPVNLAKNTLTSQLATARGKTFLREVLKCKSGVSLLQCARRVDAHNLTMASRFFLFNKMSHQNKLTSNSLYSAFGPVADGRMFTDSAIRAFRLGHFKKCNVLTGYKTYDSFTLIPFDFHHSPMIKQQDKQETITFLGLVQAVKKFYSFYPTHPFNHTNVLLDTMLIQYTRLFEKSHFEHPSLIKVNYYPTFFKMVNDESFACPTLKFIDHVARYSRVYLYVNNVPDRKLVNNSMVSFMLDKTTSGGSVDVTNEMNERWANFVKYDSPNSNTSNVTWPHYLPYDNSHDTLLDESLSEYHVVNSTLNETTTTSKLDSLYLSLSNRGISVKRMASTDNCLVWNTLIPATMDSLAELKKDLAASKCPKSDKSDKKKQQSGGFFKKFKLF